LDSICGAFQVHYPRGQLKGPLFFKHSNHNARAHASRGRVVFGPACIKFLTTHKKFDRRRATQRTEPNSQPTAKTGEKSGPKPESAPQHSPPMLPPFPAGWVKLGHKQAQKTARQKNFSLRGINFAAGPPTFRGGGPNLNPVGIRVSGFHGENALYNRYH
jgi:hypothetical protein